MTHEQTYYRWIERAWRGGLRLYVNLFVENSVLCELFPLKRNSCDEMDSVRLQARDIYEMQDYIDAQSGGPGKGFFRIVTNPFQARKVIADGKLAVVLGIEVSELFNCSHYDYVPDCNKDDIDRQLDEVYKLGVRDMELVNKFDNALAGVAGDGGTAGPVVNNGNKYETDTYWDFETCQTTEGDKEQPALPRDALIGNGLAALLPPGTAPVYPEGPHCNTRGLTDLGEYLVRKMMERRMVDRPRPPQPGRARRAVRGDRVEALLGPDLEPQLVERQGLPAHLRLRRRRRPERQQHRGLLQGLEAPALASATASTSTGSASART